jgi:hypothetical protein
MMFSKQNFAIFSAIFVPLCSSAALLVKLSSQDLNFNTYIAGMEAAAASFSSRNPGHPECVQFTFSNGSSSFSDLTALPVAGEADDGSDYFVSMDSLPARFQLTSDAHFGSFNAPQPSGNRLLTKVTATGWPDEEHTLFAAGEGGTSGGDPLLLQQANHPLLHFLQETAGPELHGLDEGAPFHAMQKVDPADGDAVEQYLIYLDIDTTSGISSGDPMFYLSGATPVAVPEPAFTWLALSIGAVTMLVRQRRKKAVPGSRR